MFLSDIGCIAHQYRLDIPNHFPHVSLDIFVIMPDHIHGIISIDEKNNKKFNVETSHWTSQKNKTNTNETRHVSIHTNETRHVSIHTNETRHVASLQTQQHIQQQTKNMF